MGYVMVDPLRYIDWVRGKGKWLQYIRYQGDLRVICPSHNYRRIKSQERMIIIHGQRHRKSRKSEVDPKMSGGRE
jgi:hypothetical protein